MALKKSQLYSSLWKSCDELRGGMDASQYKDYILTLLFMKYVSDKYGGHNAAIDIPEGGGFADMATLKGNPEIGDKINKIIAKFAEANDLKDVLHAVDFNDNTKLGDGKEMQDRLSKLIAIFETLDFRDNRAAGDDLLGDAYEYLMRHFATESGKSKGQFYTPAEVSRVMAKVVGIKHATSQEETIYDPTCGSGSLLLKAADEAPRGISIFGQEMDNATWALAKMNMFLHDQPGAVLEKGNTLASPKFTHKDGTLRTFNYAVANPPFSSKAWSSGLDPLNDEYSRFVYGVPPAKNGDYAFLLHILASLKSKGKGAIILPHGVLFRGGAEASIRRKLLSQGYIKGIIGLPANLFYGTGIPACIVVVDKEDANLRTGVFIVDASKGFVKDGNKNRLREQDIHKIVDVFIRQHELPRYSRFVPETDIAANDYNLNIPRYIDSSEPEDLHDLDAHLNGGIPNRDLDALAPYWQVFPTLRADLFAPGDRPGYSRATVATADVKPTILNHPEFIAFSARVSAIFDQWAQTHHPLLTSLTIGIKPKEIIDTLAEDLLDRFSDLPLLDNYDLYQRLLDYWNDTMQDDLYLIATDGWLAAAQPRPIIEAKEVKETPDLVVGKTKVKLDLIPPALIVARFFADKQTELDTLDTARSAATAALEEFIEEHSGDDGLLEDAKTDKGAITKASIKDRLKTLFLAGEPDTDDERAALSHVSTLIDAETTANRTLKDAQSALDALVLKRYVLLTESDIKTLVINDKWLTTIRESISGEVERSIHRLTARLTAVETRYAKSVAELNRSSSSFELAVENHLLRMGLEPTTILMAAAP